MVHRKSMILELWLALITCATCTAVACGAGDTQLPPALEGVTYDQQLNAQVPLELTFVDDTGQQVQLADYFRADQPVILVLAYYQCPRLCTLVLNGLVQSMLEIDMNAGQEFQVVTVSFDPREDWHLAADKKRSYVDRYRRPGAAAGWHFLTGEQSNIKRLTDSVGFHYRFDEQRNQFVHASGIVVLTPEGKVSRYFYDVTFPPRDLRLGLVEASHNEIGSAVDQILLYCLHYDATLGRYSARIMNLVRVFGVMIMLGIGAFVVVLRKTHRAASTHETGSDAQEPVPPYDRGGPL